jgi:hypothetical protein
MSKIEINPNEPSEKQILEEKNNERIKEGIFELMFGQPTSIFFRDPNLGKDPKMLLEKALKSLQGSLPEDQFINLSLKDILESQGGEFLELLIKNIVLKKRAPAELYSKDKNVSSIIKDELQRDPISFIGCVLTEYRLLSNERSKEDYKKEFGVEPEPYSYYTPDERQMRRAIEAHVAKAVKEKASRQQLDPVSKYIEEKYGPLLEKFPMGFFSLRYSKDNRLP